MNLFYTPDIENHSAFMSEEESKHCIKVLRMQQGDAVFSADGNGHFYNGTIINASPKRCEVRITEIIEEKKDKTVRIHIAIGPTKNINRLEWFLEKTTEIGIDTITPVYSFHSERKVIKPERLEKILLSAMKQSLKATLPELKPEMKFKDFIRQQYQGEKYFAYCGEMEKKLLQNSYCKGNDAIIMIGPEGGYSPEEAALATENGFSPISLGSARLRTETAGIVACHTIRMLNETSIYTLK